MVSIQQVHVVQGRPVASAQLIGALVRKAGHRLRVFGDATKARCEITRSDDPDFTFVAEWTIERARDAKLTGKETWRAYPANMLKARAITECARDACPEALAGVSYTAEELGDEDAVAEAFPTTVEVVPETDDGAVHPEATVHVSGAAPSSDIADAEIVDEATGEILPDDVLAAVASQAERVAAGRTLHEPSAAPTDAAFRALQAGLSGYAKAHGIDRAEVIARVATVLDRAVASTKDLDAAEVSLLLNRLPRKAAA
jgi:hypothetical protein